MPLHSARWRDTTGLPSPDEMAQAPPEPDGPVLDSGQVKVTLSAMRPAGIAFTI